MHYCAANSTLYVADTYNHKIKVLHESDAANLSRETSLNDWIGSSSDKKPRVHDGVGGGARLNEPNGCWARVSPDGTFLGLYVADTGNDCIRFATPNGQVRTLALQGVPDVRLTARSADCDDGVCRIPGQSEEEKKAE